MNKLQSKKIKYISRKGFTLIELSAVIVVLGVLAGIVYISYDKVVKDTQASKAETDLLQAHKSIEAYKARYGHYPVTTSGDFVGDEIAGLAQPHVTADGNCSIVPDDATQEWVPDVNGELAQSVDKSNGGTRNFGGCYMYSSNGDLFVLSAWNMLDEPQTEKYYRRLGFRETDPPLNTQGHYYLCNHPAVGGVMPGHPYDIDYDFYKTSYTISNVEDCDETPPAGA